MLDLCIISISVIIGLTATAVIIDDPGLVFIGERVVNNNYRWVHLSYVDVEDRRYKYNIFLTRGEKISLPKNITGVGYITSRSASEYRHLRIR